jgi:hypothetical protein
LVESNKKLMFPLLKGYDDYDMELAKLFGPESKEVLSMIESHTKKPHVFKRMRTLNN